MIRRDELAKIFPEQDFLRQMENLLSDNPRFKSITVTDTITGKNLTLSNSLKVGDIDGGNYFEVESDGTDVRYGDATQWDDLSNSIIAAKLDSASGRLDYDYFNAGVSFAANARYPEEPVIVPIQGRHAMLIGTGAVARPHFHWLQEQSGVPNFLLAYKITNYGDTTVFETDFTNYTLLPWSDNAFTYTAGVLAQITEFPEIDISSLELSGSLDMAIFRDSANASGEFAGADPVVAATTVKYNDSHVKFDMIGSRTEYTK